MSEEIFEPLLPIIKADYRRACEITKSMEHPLGLYIFSSDQKESMKVSFSSVSLQLTNY